MSNSVSMLERRELIKAKKTSYKPKNEIIIGKDILELLSNAMYVNPLTIYREYLQNSADSIDEGVKEGSIQNEDEGRIDINIDSFNRNVTIRDNGAGLSNNDFEIIMTAFGGSKKRDTGARGFRGVGRLAGIGFCRELIFRSKAVGETQVLQISWNCQKIKSILIDQNYKGVLFDVVNDVVSLSTLAIDEYPDHFFEVELRNIIKHKKDSLIDPDVIEHYIAQIAPVPFSPKFSYAAEITKALGEHISMGNMNVFINNRISPVYRPYLDEFNVSDTIQDSFKGKLESFNIPNVAGEIGAIGWILHHNYLGAIATRSGIKGLRVRSGNIQVGEDNLLDEIFPETRFNSWTVGEVHVVDKNIKPNGRRDNFEQNIHFLNLVNHLSVRGRDIAKRCRTSSLIRNRIKEFELEERRIKEKEAFLTQQILPEKNYVEIKSTIKESLQKMQLLTNSEFFTEEIQKELFDKIYKIESKFTTNNSDKNNDPLSTLPEHKREIYQEVFGLVYECSANHVVARSLIDRILIKLS